MADIERRGAGTLAIAAGALVVVHGLPGVTSIPPVGRRIAPRLAGIGRPDHVALTFDDGPDPASTPRFLDLLDDERVSATFFLLGSLVRLAPELAAEIRGRGHEIALHGHTHRCHLVRSPRDTYDDLARGTAAVAAATGHRPRWFRPPYGVLTAATLIAAHRLGLTPVLWSTWGRDWTARATPASIERRVRSSLAGGATILLHDSDSTSAPGSWRNTLDAVPGIVEHCRARGWRVGPLGGHGLR